MIVDTIIGFVCNVTGECPGKHR